MPARLSLLEWRSGCRSDRERRGGRGHGARVARSTAVGAPAEGACCPLISHESYQRSNRAYLFDLMTPRVWQLAHSASIESAHERSRPIEHCFKLFPAMTEERDRLDRLFWGQKARPDVDVEIGSCERRSVGSGALGPVLIDSLIERRLRLGWSFSEEMARRQRQSTRRCHGRIVHRERHSRWPTHRLFEL